jgi:hypothetical protein
MLLQSILKTAQKDKLLSPRKPLCNYVRCEVLIAWNQKDGGTIFASIGISGSELFSIGPRDRVDQESRQRHRITSSPCPHGMPDETANW